MAQFTLTEVEGTSSFLVQAQTGLSGDIQPGNTTATISCPQDKYLRITALWATGSNNISNLTLLAGTRTVIDNKTLLRQNNSNASGSLIKIGFSGAAADAQTHEPILGKINEDFTFTFPTALVDFVRFTYEVLEDA